MLVLYNNNLSVCSQKVRIVLLEKNVPWTNRDLEHHQRRASDARIQKDKSARGGASARARRQHDRRIQRDLHVPGRGIPEPTAQSKEPSGAGHNAPVVQIAR